MAVSKHTTKWGIEVNHRLFDRGMTVKQLASEIGYSRSNVSSVISGKLISENIESAINKYLGIEQVS